MFPVGLALQEELSDLSGVVEESVTGIRVVKGFGAERLQRDAARGRGRQRLRPLDRAGASCAPTSCPQIDFLPALGLVGILWYGGHQVLDGNLSVGDIVAANLYVLMLIWPLRMVGMLLAQLPRSAAAAGRINDVLVTDPAIEDVPHARPLPDGPGEVRFEDVTFGYGPGRRVLDGLDLVIPGGQAIALVGATGIGQVDRRPAHPALLRHRRRPHPRRRHRRARGAAARRPPRGRPRVRGHVPLLRLACAPTSRSPIPRRRWKRCVRAARLAGADDFVRELPDGYDTVIGEHGYSLSGGQRQRIAIARAVLADPRILILDDATSSVDPTQGARDPRRARRGDGRAAPRSSSPTGPATIALADRVVLIDDGRIIADGTHDGLLESSAEYREVLARAALRRARPVDGTAPASPSAVTLP